jgi:hypothetical protein
VRQTFLCPSPAATVSAHLILFFESSHGNFLRQRRQWRRRRRTLYHLKVRVRLALLQRRLSRPLFALRGSFISSSDPVVLIMCAFGRVRDEPAACATDLGGALAAATSAFLVGMKSSSPPESSPNPPRPRLPPPPPRDLRVLSVACFSLTKLAKLQHQKATGFHSVKK